jgi:hypothetical protein
VIGQSPSAQTPAAFLAKPAELPLFGAFEHLFGQNPELLGAAKADLLLYNFAAVAQALERAAQSEARPPVKLKAMAAARGLGAYGEAFNQRLQWLASLVDGGQEPEVFLDGVTWRAVSHRGEWLTFRASIVMDGVPEQLDVQFWDLSPEVLFELLSAGGVRDEAGRAILATFAILYGLPLSDGLLIDFADPQDARDLKTLLEAVVNLQSRGGLSGLVERWRSNEESLSEAAQAQAQADRLAAEREARNRQGQQRPGNQGWGPPSPPQRPDFQPPPHPGQNGRGGPGQGPGGRGGGRPQRSR